MGGLLSIVAQSFPPAPKWAVTDIPDLSGKVVVVTGRTTSNPTAFSLD